MPDSLLHFGILSCLYMCIKHLRDWQLKFYKEASSHFLAFQHCAFRKRLWFAVLGLCPALIRGLRIVGINAVSFDFLQLPYEHAHRFLMYPRVLNTCVTNSQLT